MAEDIARPPKAGKLESAEGPLGTFWCIFALVVFQQLGVHECEMQGDDGFLPLPSSISSWSLLFAAVSMEAVWMWVINVCRS